MKRIPMVWLGGLAAAGLAGWGYFLWDRRQKASFTEAFHQALRQLLDPSAQGLDQEAALDIGYWQSANQEALRKHGRGVAQLESTQALRYAQAIEDCFGGIWGDDEARLYAIFREIGDKALISQIAKAYQQRYQTNLIERFRQKLDEGEIATLLNIIKPKPPYSL